MNLQGLLDSLEDEEREAIEDSIERLMGDEELYISHFVKFPENQNIIELRKAVEAREAKASEDQAHSLKGIAANLGILEVQDVCAEMVWDFRNGQPEEGFSLIDDVQEAFDKWAAKIKAAE